MFKNLDIHGRLFISFIIIAFLAAITAFLGSFFTNKVGKEGEKIATKIAPAYEYVSKNKMEVTKIYETFKNSIHEIDDKKIDEAYLNAIKNIDEYINNYNLILNNELSENLLKQKENEQFNKNLEIIINDNKNFKIILDKLYKTLRNETIVDSINNRYTNYLSQFRKLLNTLQSNTKDNPHIKESYKMALAAFELYIQNIIQNKEFNKDVINYLYNCKRYLTTYPLKNNEITATAIEICNNLIKNLDKKNETNILYISSLKQFDNEYKKLFNDFTSVESYLSALFDNSILKLRKTNTSTLYIMILAGTIIFIIAISLSFIVTNSFKKVLGGNLHEISEIISRISEGDLTFKINKEKATGLMASVYHMKEELTQIIGEILTGAENIAAASQQLQATSQQLSQGANEQASSAEEISSSMEEMVANIQQNTENARQTEKISLNTLKSTNEIKEAARQSLVSINEIASKINIINDIAFQTNILALNAAVEAARAGANGKGFAVVAAEIRKLAERSKQAADDIIVLTKNSVDVTQNAFKLMEDLIPQIEKSTNLVQEIAAASIEQNTGVEQVNNAIQILNQIAQENAAASEEMATSAEELSSQAEQLRDMVSYFKIDKEFFIENKELLKNIKQNRKIKFQKVTTHSEIPKKEYNLEDFKSF